jgi:hypothetical protein
MGYSTGMKLIRVMTGKTTALYAKVSCVKAKVGKMKYSPGQEYGGEFQITEVTSLLAIVEVDKRYSERGCFVFIK